MHFLVGTELEAAFSCLSDCLPDEIMGRVGFVSCLVKQRILNEYYIPGKYSTKKNNK